jgi:dTDP-4-dehydrorhamnose reductase
MKLLLTGAEGQIGWELTRSLLPLGEVVALGRKDFDLARPERLPNLVRSIAPDVIVNAAAYTAVDKAEQEEELATLINGTAVGVIAETARSAGALLVHFSTDYVFDGRSDAPYTENDATHPINAYGRSKLLGELEVTHSGCLYIILRSSWIYSSRGHNFVRTILSAAREHKQLQVVTDQVGVPTWARNIADVTVLIIRQTLQERQNGQFSSGIFNLTAGGATSWYGFAETIFKTAQRMGLLSELPPIHPVASQHYQAAAQRPKNSRLAGDRLYQRFGIRLPDWREGLTLCLEEIASMSACKA